jgi:hypothetical protein
LFGFYSDLHFIVTHIKQHNDKRKWCSGSVAVPTSVVTYSLIQKSKDFPGGNKMLIIKRGQAKKTKDWDPYKSIKKKCQIE